MLIVDKEDKVQPRPIKTGGMSGNAWIVTDGLNEGDQVIIEGHLKARPGSTVKPVQWRAISAGAVGKAPAAATPGSDADTLAKRQGAAAEAPKPVYPGGK